MRISSGHPVLGKVGHHVHEPSSLRLIVTEPDGAGGQLDDKTLHELVVTCFGS